MGSHGQLEDARDNNGSSGCQDEPRSIRVDLLVDLVQL